MPYAGVAVTGALSGSAPLNFAVETRGASASPASAPGSTTDFDVAAIGCNADVAVAIDYCCQLLHSCFLSRDVPSFHFHPAGKADQPSRKSRLSAVGPVEFVLFLPPRSAEPVAYSRIAVFSFEVHVLVSLLPQ